MLFWYWAGENGLGGDYTWVTGFVKCLMVWHRPRDVSREKLVLAQTSNQKTTLLLSTLPPFSPASRSQRAEGRPRILTLERESIPWQSLHSMSYSSLHRLAQDEHFVWHSVRLADPGRRGIQSRPTQGLVSRFHKLLFLTIATKLVPCLGHYSRLATIRTDNLLDKILTLTKASRVRYIFSF